MFKYFVLSNLVLIYSSCESKFVNNDQCLTRFPSNFMFGVASSAHQVEGAWNEGGKSLGSWDHFTHTKPDIIADRTNGDTSSDSYHKTEEDVSRLKYLGVHFYRFSLSWSRIVPSHNKLNLEGVQYYDHLINLLLANNIKPMITLFHWDLPQYLEDIGGFTNPNIIDSFVQFSRFVFRQFGDRVKLWSTINEPKAYCMFAYGDVWLAPGINQSGIADYMCGHNVLKAHAKAYHLYNNEFKPTQKGKITLVVDSPWGVPASSSAEDIAAVERYMQFETGWFAHPVFSKNGDYPVIMKEQVAKYSKMQEYPGSRLPAFTQEEIRYIKGTSDFFFLNHYIIEKVADRKIKSPNVISFSVDKEVKTSFDDSWGNTTAPIFKVAPWALTKLLAWIKKEYNNPEIYITENGYCDKGEILDIGRVSYFKEYLKAILEAICKYDVNVKGYTAWSFVDSFEWYNGYTFKFGLYHVNFSDPLRPRTAKSSAEYYKNVISTRTP